LRSTVAKINLSHLESNYRFIKGFLKPQQMLCPMVKADSYGHGDIMVSRRLVKIGVDYLGVALVEEGIHLRKAGIKEPILVFSPSFNGMKKELIEFSLTPVLSSWDQLSFPEISSFPIHLKFNTGMQRLGFDPEDCEKIAHQLAGQSRFHLSGICTHLIDSDDWSDPHGKTRQQLKIFERVKRAFKGVPYHFLNSSGIFLKVDEKSGARPGIALYGYTSVSDENIKRSLKPVMNLKSKVALVKKIKKGETVSYNGLWTAKRESYIGVVPIGYGDGYPRQLSNIGMVLFRGKKIPIRGTVCMDYTMVDLTHAVGEKKPQVGEEISLFGEQAGCVLSAEDLAVMTKTIPYEIITRVGPRVPRVYCE